MRKDILNAILELKGVKTMINKSELARRFGCSINTVNNLCFKQTASSLSDDAVSFFKVRLCTKH